MSRHSQKEIERIKRIASKMPVECPAQGSFAAPSGYAARFDQLKAELNERRLREISEMLTDAGVPEWVMNAGHNGVPSNSDVSRLKWYLARRKNVKAGEIDQQLQRDMKEAYEHARAYRERHNT